MKSSSKVLLALALALGLIVAGIILLRAPNVPDQVQITDQLEAARAAGEAHDVSGIMRIVSEKYHDANGANPVQLRFLLNKAQGNEAVRITQSIPLVSVQGDAATSTSHVRVVTADNRVLYDQNMTLHWAREDGSRLGVIPAKVWRVVNADYGVSLGY